jgi:DNA-binding MarR family transcriptional regulator
MCRSEGQKTMARTDAEKLRALIHAFIRNFGLLDQTRTPCGMPISVSDAHALMELLKDPGIEQMELSRRLGLSKSAVSRLLQRLKRRGQIQRMKSKDDGRAYNIRLTEKGLRQADMINHESLATFGMIISGLSKDSTDRLLECLPPLIEALPKCLGKLDSNLIHFGRLGFKENR